LSIIRLLEVEAGERLIGAGVLRVFGLLERYTATVVAGEGLGVLAGRAGHGLGARAEVVLVER